MSMSIFYSPRLQQIKRMAYKKRTTITMGIFFLSMKNQCTVHAKTNLTIPIASALVK